MKTLPPGSTIGILGGGQLGRMIALSAARLGYRCRIFCGAGTEPAVEVAASATVADFTDLAAIEAFAATVDVVTLEWENVPLVALEALQKTVPVRPGLSVLRVAQDRRLEKRAAQRAGIGTAPFADIFTLDDLRAAVLKLGLPAILKTARMGYDGKGQVLITAETDLSVAWDQVGRQESVLEGFVSFASEASVIVARGEDGAVAAYPVVQNTHKNHILFETQAPASLPQAVADEARDVALKMANTLQLVGLMAVELFVLPAPNAAGQSVLLNEIAPRPHNSGHWTIDACACSQYEQVVRAACGLPLGSTTPHSKAVMRNLLGDEVDAWPEYLANPSACLHLYGKTEKRPGRKMGHVTFLNGNWDT